LADFKTPRDNYITQWEQLEFQSVFDTFVEERSAVGFSLPRFSFKRINEKEGPFLISQFSCGIARLLIN
jgi:hypothetical protein